MTVRVMAAVRGLSNNGRPNYRCGHDHVAVTDTRMTRNSSAEGTPKYSQLTKVLISTITKMYLRLHRKVEAEKSSVFVYCLLLSFPGKLPNNQ